MTSPRKSQKTTLSSVLLECSPRFRAPLNSSTSSTTLSPMACMHMRSEDIHKQKGDWLAGFAQQCLAMSQHYLCSDGECMYHHESINRIRHVACVRACRPLVTRRQAQWGAQTCRVPGRMRSGTSWDMW